MEGAKKGRRKNHYSDGTPFNDNARESEAKSGVFIPRHSAGPGKGQKNVPGEGKRPGESPVSKSAGVKKGACRSLLVALGRCHGGGGGGGRRNQRRERNSENNASATKHSLDSTTMGAQSITQPKLSLVKEGESWGGGGWGEKRERKKDPISSEGSLTDYCETPPWDSS